MSDEKCAAVHEWVVERGSSEPSSPEYLTAAMSGVSWTSSPFDALKFADRFSASELASTLFGPKHDHRICDHIWE
jgi:hypothetical protein